MNIQWIGSPNFSSGRGGKNIDFIVCHWIVGDVAAADSVFQNTSRQTSAHYALNSGVIHQYVREQDTAWHAGSFDINQRSIGIEHRGGPNMPIDDGTYEKSAQLIADICRRYGRRIPLRKHNEFFATACPGNLDINRLNARVDQLLGTGEEMIQAGDNWYARLNKLHNQVLGRSFPKLDFNSYWVGKPLLSFIEAVSDQATADSRGNIATVAIRDNWEGQINTLSTQLKDTQKQVADLQSKLSIQSDDTKLLNSFGELLQKLIIRIGLKK